jgi:hypothetical protein
MVNHGWEKIDLANGSDIPSRHLGYQRNHTGNFVLVLLFPSALYALYWGLGERHKLPDFQNWTPTGEIV